MAVIIVNEGGDWNEELYDQVFERVIPDRSDPPDGLIAHVASQGEQGWRVVDVWESEGHRQRFNEERVMPVAQEVNAPGFDTKITEVHNLLIP